MTLDERIADLTAKLEARKDTPGYKRNVIALRAEIARLKLEQSRGDDPDQ
jgi:uncharacterized small protein (DUF1192 family)